jgi:tRNA(Ile)-lysidine synthase
MGENDPMPNTLFKALKEFFEARRLSSQPLLLGYSGGPDSKTLLYLLLECRRFFSFSLHLAHVDHGWREESASQAALLAQEAEQLHLPFHLKTLETKDFLSGNLEEQGRNFRLQYFKTLYDQLGCQALLLGHHADDQAEVVLKRVFEGAHLSSVGGLLPVSQLIGMNVWRPLLLHRKKTMLTWLKEQSKSALMDPTNESELFLRGKMRQTLIPTLQEAFGKEIASNLCRLGREAHELREYFEHKQAPIHLLVQKEAEGWSWDLNPFFPLALIELKYLLKARFSEEGVMVARDTIEKVAIALMEKTGKKKFSLQRGTVIVISGKLTFNRC